MKRYILYLTFVFIGIQFTGCKKYAEGPAFTLLSKKQRAANTWQIDTYFENGVNKTADALNVYKNFVLILDKNNMKYSKSFMALGLLSYGESGSWKFSADQNSLEFTPDNTSIAAYSWKILKLKEKSLGLSYTTNNVEAKLYLK